MSGLKNLVNVGTSSADLAAAGIKSANFAGVTKSLTKLDGAFKQTDKLSTALKENLKNADDFAALSLIMAKNDNLIKNSDEALEIAKAASKALPSDSAIMAATRKSAAQVKKAKDSSDSFFKSKEFQKGVAVVGVTAAGIATLMLLTGESDPAKAIGDQLGTAAGAAGAAAGTAAGSAIGAALDTSGAGEAAGDIFGGIGDFFKQWGLLMGLCCFCMIMMVVIMMTLK